MKKYLLVAVGVVAMAFITLPTNLRAVSGTVVAAEDGEPLPGVNVSIQGTTRGTVTDISGYYRIEGVGDTDVLIFGSIGYKTKEVEVK